MTKPMLDLTVKYLDNFAEDGNTPVDAVEEEAGDNLHVNDDMEDINIEPEVVMTDPDNEMDARELIIENDVTAHLDENGHEREREDRFLSHTDSPIQWTGIEFMEKVFGSFIDGVQSEMAEEVATVFEEDFFPMVDESMITTLGKYYTACISRNVLISKRRISQRKALKVCKDKALE